MLSKAGLKTIAIMGIIAASAIYGVQVFATHDYEFATPPTFMSHGNRGSPLIPDNTHVRLDNIVLPPGAVLPLYDSSPSYVAGHFLLNAPCVLDHEDEHGTKVYRPTVVVIAGHIDESAENTHVMPMPLFYIPHASNPPNMCIFHAHIPDPISVDPIEENAPRVTDIALVNNSDNSINVGMNGSGGMGGITSNSGKIIKFGSYGYAADINIQRVLGSIGQYYKTEFTGPKMLPSDILADSSIVNPVFVLHDGSHSLTAALSASSGGGNEDE